LRSYIQLYQFEGLTPQLELRGLQDRLLAPKHLTLNVTNTSTKIFIDLVKSINSSFLNICKDNEIEVWFELVDQWIATRGKRDTIKRIKQIRLHCTRYLCGNALHETSGYPLSINRKGLPRCLRGLIP